MSPPDWLKRRLVFLVVPTQPGAERRISASREAYRMASLIVLGRRAVPRECAPLRPVHCTFTGPLYLLTGSLR